jgi:LysR family nitrogen assimilation transcriptional regulator
MDLRQLRYFVSIVELKSFTKAAEILRVAQPALSAQIRNLEDELQVQLLVRHSRGVQPTDAGQTLLEHARKILDEVDRTRSALLESSGVPRGKVTLGVTPSTDVELTSKIVHACLKDFPEIQLNIVEGISADVVEWVQAGRADLGIVYNVGPEPADIALEPLIQEDLIFIQARSAEETGATISLADACQYPLILARPPHGVRSLIEDAANRQGFPVQVPFEMQSVAAIFELIEQGMACSILPMGAISRKLRHGPLVARTLIDPRVSVTLSLAHSTTRPLGAAEIALRGLVSRLAVEWAQWS